MNIFLPIVFSSVISIDCLIFNKSQTAYRYDTGTRIPYENCIKIDDSTLSRVIRNHLINEGLVLEYLREDNRNRQKVIERIINRINVLYKEYHYIDGHVKDFKLLDTGKLHVKCYEGFVHKQNVRVFCRDDKGVSEDGIDFGPSSFTNIIGKSDPCIPSGRYKRVKDSYLSDKITRDVKLLKCDVQLFNVIKSIGLYKNLHYIIHRNDGNIYYDIFYDGYGSTMSISPTITVMPEDGLGLSLGYKNLNLLDKKFMLYAAGDFDVLKMSNNRHKFLLQFTSDVVDLHLWKLDVTNCSLFKVSTATQITNLLRPSIKNVRDVNTLLVYMKRLDGIRYLVSGGIDLYNISLFGKLSNKLHLNVLKNPITTNTNLLFNIPHNVADIKQDSNIVDNTNKFRIDHKIALLFNSGHILETKWVVTHKIKNNDFRGRVLRANDGQTDIARGGGSGDGIARLSPITLLSKLHFIFSQELHIPIKLKRFNFVPYTGIFCDVLLFDKFNDYNVSLGIKFSIFNVTLAIPFLAFYPKLPPKIDLHHKNTYLNFNQDNNIP